MLICRYLKAFIISKIEHYDLLHAIHNCGSEFWKNKEETKTKNHTELSEVQFAFILPDMFTFIYSFNTFLLSLCATHHSRLCCCSVAESCPTLCNHMDCSMPGLPVHHHLLEFAQIHVHWISDAIQPSHPLLPSSPPALNLSSMRVFPNELVLAPGVQSIGASVSIIPMNIWGWFPLGLTGLISLHSQGLSTVFSSTTIGEPQPSLWSNSHNCTWLLEKP